MTHRNHYPIIKDRVYDRLTPEQLDAANARIASRKFKANWEAEGRRMRRQNREIARQINEDNPGGCEKCGAPFGVEIAEVVNTDGDHLVVHVECIDGEDMA